jgi:transposase-like protein
MRRPTILRWVIRYIPEFEKYWQAHERVVGDSWRMDETYLKVRGQWVHRTAPSIKRVTRLNPTSVARATSPPPKPSLSKAFRHHGDPRVITLDGFEPTHAALRRMGMNNEFNYRWEGAGPPAHQGPGRSNARVQVLHTKDYQRPVSSTRKVRDRSGRDMAQRTRGAKVVPICNRPHTGSPSARTARRGVGLEASAGGERGRDRAGGDQRRQMFEHCCDFIRLS